MCSELGQTKQHLIASTRPRDFQVTIRAYDKGVKYPLPRQCRKTKAVPDFPMALVCYALVTRRNIRQGTTKVIGIFADVEKRRIKGEERLAPMQAISWAPKYRL